MVEAAPQQSDSSGLQGLDRSLGRLTGGFSIRLLLLSAIGFLSILLLTALGLQATSAWVTYRTAAQFAVLNEATDIYVGLKGGQGASGDEQCTGDITTTAETAAIAAFRNEADGRLKTALARRRRADADRIRRKIPRGGRNARTTSAFARESTRNWLFPSRSVIGNSSRSISIAAICSSTPR
jgi:hypothetical protein